MTREEVPVYVDNAIKTELEKINIINAKYSYNSSKGELSEQGATERLVHKTQTLIEKHDNKHGQSSKHFEGIAYVIMRSRIINAVKEGIENSQINPENIFSEGVLEYIVQNENLSISSYFYPRTFFSNKRIEGKPMRGVVISNWVVAAIRLWIDNLPSDERERIFKEYKFKDKWENTTEIRKFILEAMDNKPYYFKEFFNKTPYEELVSKYDQPYTSVSSTTIFADNAISAIESLSKKIDELSKSSSIETTGLKTSIKDINSSLSRLKKFSEKVDTIISREEDKRKAPKALRLSAEDKKAIDDTFKAVKDLAINFEVVVGISAVRKKNIELELVSKLTDIRLINKTLDMTTRKSANKIKEDDHTPFGYIFVVKSEESIRSVVTEIIKTNPNFTAGLISTYLKKYDKDGSIIEINDNTMQNYIKTLK